MVVDIEGGCEIRRQEIALEKMYPVRFNQCIDRKSRSILALAPAAMAAVNNERLRGYCIAYLATGAAAFAGAAVE